MIIDINASEKEIKTKILVNKILNRFDDLLNDMMEVGLMYEIDIEENGVTENKNGFDFWFDKISKSGIDFLTQCPWLSNAISSKNGNNTGIVAAECHFDKVANFIARTNKEALRHQNNNGLSMGFSGIMADNKNLVCIALNDEVVSKQVNIYGESLEDLAKMFMPEIFSTGMVEREKLHIVSNRPIKK